MNTQRIILTNGDPSGTVQNFLGAIWAQAGLDGMLVAASSDQPTTGKARLIERGRAYRGSQSIQPADDRKPGA